MRNDTYLVPRNGPCPVCKGTIRGTKSGLFFNCIDCKRVYKDVSDELKYGGENDHMLRCLNEKRLNNE